MSLSPFDNALLRGLLGDAEVDAALCVEADIAAMLTFEAALARAEASHGLMSSEAAETIAKACATLRPDLDALALGVATDGVVVPALVRQLRAAAGPAAAAQVHMGATSQDVIDTGLMLRLKPLAGRFAARLEGVIARLAALEAAFGTRPMMGRTRMQAALPITVADRLRSWSAPLALLVVRFNALLFPLQFGGAVGTLEGLGGKGPQVRATLAASLGLVDVPQWHSTRTTITDLANLLALVTGSLGKMGQDIALMAQAGDEIALSGGGGSSAMAHKQNPVGAETLVALARFNAVQVSALQQSMVHEQERSGTAWTLEWLALPHMLAATGAALRHADALAGSITRLGAAD